MQERTILIGVLMLLRLLLLNARTRQRRAVMAGATSIDDDDDDDDGGPAGTSTTKKAWATLPEATSSKSNWSSGGGQQRKVAGVLPAGICCARAPTWPHLLLACCAMEWAGEKSDVYVSNPVVGASSKQHSSKCLHHVQSTMQPIEWRWMVIDFRSCGVFVSAWGFQFDRSFASVVG